MEYKLKKRPDSPTIIHGFPGLGLVSTIVTKFLIDHLDTEIIGNMGSETLTPLAAIHKGSIVFPITIYHNKKYNLVIIQSLTEVANQEWETTQSLIQLTNELKAKETIIIEGMPSQENKVDLYHYSTKSKVIGKTTPLKEGIVGGLTASFILKAKDLPFTCLFAEAHADLPDTEAAAKVVEVLNDYLGLDLDCKPLLKQAQKFEHNLKKVLTKVKEIKDIQTQKKPDRETLDYLG